MVVYYIKKVGESLADYRYPIKDGDICMLYDGEAIKTIYIDSELDPDSIWRDFKFIDTKSLKSYQFPTSDSILCAPVGDKHAIGDTVLLTQLIKECKGEWLLDFLNETSAVLSGFVDYWDLGILRRFIGDDNLDVEYENEETLNEFLEKPEENKEVNKYDEEEVVDDADLLPMSYDVKWFCLSALACLKGQMDERGYQILYDTLNGVSRSELASRFNLTQERIRQIVVKVAKQAKELLIEQRKCLEETKAENAQLNAQLNLLREDIVGLKALLPKETITRLRNENEELSVELASLLETPIIDLALPMRAANILIYMGIKKFADIPQIESYTRVLKERNSGKKTVHDITQMLEDFYLTFGMSYNEIVDVLKVRNWQTAKRKWIREDDDKDCIKGQNGDDNYNKELVTGNVFNATPSNATQDKGKRRVGYIVKLFPSQLTGEIIRVRKDSKGVRKLTVKTKNKVVEINDLPYLYEVIRKKTRSKVKVKKDNLENTKRVTPEKATIVLTKEIIESARTPNGGFTKSQLAAIGIGWPPPQDWIEEKVGTRITPTQLAGFNHIEYVAKPSESSYQLTGSETYKNVVSNSDDSRKMKAILQAMTHFYAPATPHDIARTISRTAWGGSVVREETVDSFLKLLPEVEYVKWGKYILKSRNKYENGNDKG